MVIHESYFKYQFCTHSRTVSNFTNLAREDHDVNTYEDEENDVDDVDEVLLISEEFQDSQKGTVSG